LLIKLKLYGVNLREFCGMQSLIIGYKMLRLIDANTSAFWNQYVAGCFDSPVDWNTEETLARNVTVVCQKS